MQVFAGRHRGGLKDLLLALKLPRIGDYMSAATVKSVHAKERALLGAGAKLLDISIDLGAVLPHDCPPVSQFRIAMRDRAWLRRIAVKEGDVVEAGALLAIFSSEADEPLDAAPARALRVSIAGILDQSNLWGSAAS